eukprot:gene37245-45957_t
MGTLGIGVTDLSDNILAVSMLKRENNQPGPGEEAGDAFWASLGFGGF